MESRDTERMLNLFEVCDMAGVSKSTIYRMVEAGTFPAPVHVGPRASRWRQSAINQWLESLES